MKSLTFILTFAQEAKLSLQPLWTIALQSVKSKKKTNQLNPKPQKTDQFLPFVLWAGILHNWELQLSASLWFTRVAADTARQAAFLHN